MAEFDFFRRLKERKLVQWALAYLAAAFVVFQGVEVLAEPWGLSASVQRSVHILLLVGFFIALVIAWYHGEKDQQRVTGTELVIIALLLGIGGGVLWMLPTGTSGTPTEGLEGWTFDADQPTIAVLPFADLNRTDSTLVFADGLHDNLLSQLHNIGSLHVISRQSVLRYRDSEKSIPTIARELGGVGTILEGTVQRSPERVLVNVQLIDAATDRHLWSQEYDRPLTAENVFALQTELATEITEKLGVRVTAAEEARLRGGGTGSLRALDLYDEALALRSAAAANRDASERIETLLREAIHLDPDFSEAYALLGSTFAVRPQIGYSLAWADSALVLARHALELDSLNAQGWATMGTALGRQGRVVDEREALLRAMELAPGHPGPITNLAATNVELARYEEGLLLGVRASRLNPHQPIPKLLVALINSALGRWEEALSWLAAAAADTSSVDLLLRPSGILVELARGRFDEAVALSRAWLAEEPESPFSKTQFALLQAREDLPAAVERATQILAEYPDFEWFDSRDLFLQLTALDRMRKGDTTAARELLQEQEATVSAAVASGNSGPEALWELGVLQAIQGQGGEAFEHLAAAVDKGLIPQPLFVGPPETDPRLASLQNDPRFQQILQTIEETRTAIRERIEVVADQLRPPTIHR
jgi:TolB-like protein